MLVESVENSLRETEFTTLPTNTAAATADFSSLFPSKRSSYSCRFTTEMIEMTDGTISNDPAFALHGLLPDNKETNGQSLNNACLYLPTLRLCIPSLGKFSLPSRRKKCLPNLGKNSLPTFRKKCLPSCEKNSLPN